jgi:hypothetical protein
MTISILSRSRVLIASATGVRVVRAGRHDDCCGWRRGCGRRLLAADLRQAQRRQTDC